MSSWTPLKGFKQLYVYVVCVGTYACVSEKCVYVCVTTIIMEELIILRGSEGDLGRLERDKEGRE